MAFFWSAKNDTKTFTNQWFDTIFGLKATNVFGLAWNYYTAYTKFITGVDLTLDMGIKCEMFFADTYKVGYANETVFGKAGRTDLHNKLVELGILKEKAVETLNNAITTDNTVVVTRNESIEEHNLEVLSQVLAAGAITQEVEGVASLDASSIVQSAVTFTTNTSGDNTQTATTMTLTAEGGLFLN